MELMRLTSSQHPLFEEAFSLYTASFPHAERRDTVEQARVFGKEDYHFDVLLEDGKLMGIVFYWQTKDFLYLEHLATKPELRNRGIGALALGLLKEKNVPIILEIEPPEDELTKRRYGFYRRNDFIMTEHYHIQAKYHIGDEDLELKILSYPHGISAAQYETFRDYMNREVGIQA